jgi:hypothetical protein
MLELEALTLTLIVLHLRRIVRGFILNGGDLARRARFRTSMPKELRRSWGQLGEPL